MDTGAIATVVFMGLMGLILLAAALTLLRGRMQLSLFAEDTDSRKKAGIAIGAGCLICAAAIFVLMILMVLTEINIISATAITIGAVTTGIVIVSTFTVAILYGFFLCRK